MTLEINLAQQQENLLDYQAPPDSLKGKVILITGAGSGLGRAVAKACAQHGATVILLGRTVKKLELTYDQIVKAGGTQPLIYPMNLEGASWQDYQNLATAIENEFGRLDALVHNAALFDSLKPLAEIKPPDWLKSLHVNLNAPFFLTQLCLPLLAKTAGANVLFVTDHVGPDAEAFWGAYGVSKAGLASLAGMWSKELRQSGIRVQLLDPGPVKTQLRELAFPAEASHVARTPEQVTPAFLYLLGAESQV